MILESYHCNLANYAWQNAQKAELSPEFFNSSLFKIGDVEGFCGEKNGVLYIAFQGTADFKDALADINIKKINLGNKIKVHAGFYKQFKTVEAFLIGKCKDANKIIFTGQSLGSSICTIAAYEMKKLYATSKAIAVVSFATPKIGNSHFVNSYNSLLIETRQYKYLNDIVPMLPPSILGYRYLTKQIVFGKKKWYDYILCMNPFNHAPKNYYTFKI
jgi:hypothetical protein